MLKGKKMNRCVFIIPYFGRFNNYFQFFLDSCAPNTNMDWLIITDDRRSFEVPSNVNMIYDSFESLKNRIRALYDFDIRLKAPYKLCDYRLAYGEIFADYIKNYDFWGFCDTDIILGNVSDYINDRILDSYDKILFRGHMTLLRNNEQCKNLYKIKKTGMPVDYRYAFTTDYSCHFDEHEMWQGICKEEGIREFRDVVYADINCDIYPFKLVGGKNGNARQVFEYKNGHIVRHYISEDGTVENDEWCYIHLQKRKMEISSHVNTNRYLIIPNKFVEYEDPVVELIQAYSYKNIYISRKINRIKEIIKNIRQGALRCRIQVMISKIRN